MPENIASENGESTCSSLTEKSSDYNSSASSISSQFIIGSSKPDLNFLILISELNPDPCPIWGFGGAIKVCGTNILILENALGGVIFWSEFW